MTTTEQQCLTSVNIADYKYHQILRSVQKDVVINLRKTHKLPYAMRVALAQKSQPSLPASYGHTT